MTTLDFWKLLAGNAALLAVAAWWLTARLQASIRHEYDKKLEEFRAEARRRERAAMIAELFAEWIKAPADPTRLNQLSWEASLWLPSDIVQELAKRLCNAPDAKDMKQILVDVRRHLWGATDPVESHHIVHFPLRAT